MICLRRDRRKEIAILEKMKEKGLFEKYGIDKNLLKTIKRYEDNPGDDEERPGEEERIAIYSIFNAYYVEKGRDPKAVEDIEGFLDFMNEWMTVEVPEDTYEVYKDIYDAVNEALQELNISRITFLDDASSLVIIKNIIAKVLDSHKKGWNTELVFRKLFFAEANSRLAGKEVIITALKEPKKGKGKTRQQHVVDKLNSLKGRVRFNQETKHWEKLDLITGKYKQMDWRGVTSVSKILNPDSTSSFPTIAAFIGTQVDAVARFFFDKSSKLWKKNEDTGEYTLTKDEDVLNDLVNTEFGSAFTLQGLRNLINDFKDLEEEIKDAIGEDCVIMASNFKMMAKAAGNRDDIGTPWVIGETDILGIDKEGKIHVFDLKTTRAKGGEDYYTPYQTNGKTNKQGDDYNKQLYHYIKMLRSYGFEVSSTPYIIVCDSFYDSRDRSIKGKHVEGPIVYKVIETEDRKTKEGYVIVNQGGKEKTMTLGGYALLNENFTITEARAIEEEENKHKDEIKEEDLLVTRVKYLQPRLHLNREGDVQALLKRPDIEVAEKKAQEILEKSTAITNKDLREIITDFEEQYEQLDEQEKLDFEDFAGEILRTRPVRDPVQLSEEDIQGTTLMATQELKMIAESTMRNLKSLLDEMAKGQSIEVNGEEINVGRKTKGKTHAEIIRLVGLNKLIEAAFEERFGKLYSEEIDEDTEWNEEDWEITREQFEAYKLLNEKINWIRDHFNQFKIMGAAKLMSLEKSVVPVRRRVKNKNRNSVPDADETIEPNDLVLDAGEDAVLESMIDKIMEGTMDTRAWSLGTREFSPRASLAQQIAELFENLSRYDANGKLVEDEYGWGVTKSMDQTEAIQIVMHACQYCYTMEAMDKALQGLLADPENGWLKQVKEKIDADEQLKKKFYRHFRKDFTRFSTCTFKIENGQKIVLTKVINTKSSYQVMMNSVGVEYNRGYVGTWVEQIGGNEKTYTLIHRAEKGKNKLTKIGSVYIADKVKTRIKSLRSELEDIFRDYGEKEDQIREAIKKQDGDGLDFVDKVDKVLKAVGINIPKRALMSYCLTKIGTSHRQSTIGLTLTRVENILNALLEQERTSEIPSGLTGNSAFGPYSVILQKVAKSVKEHVEASTYDNGKTFYSFSYPSKLQHTIDMLGNAMEDEDTFDDYIQENYGRYTGWFKDVEGAKWLNNWVERLIKNEKGARDIFAHKVEVGYMGVEYERLGSLEFQLSILTNYFGSKADEAANPAARWFAMTTMSNKTVNEFIRMLKYDSSYSRRVTEGEDGKDEYYYVNEDIVEKVLMNTFVQECNRIADVLYHYAGNRVKTANMDIDLDEDELEKLNLTGLKERIASREITADDLVNLAKIKSGAKFHFLWYLNEELANNDELAERIAKRINILLTKNDASKNVDLNEEAETTKIIREAIERNMADIVDQEIDRMRELGLFDTKQERRKGELVEVMKWQAQFNGKLGKPTESDPTGEKAMLEQIRDFIWQDIAANINIIQLTGGDLALYGTPINYQKRIAQVHSPGLPLVHDENYDDGYLRSLYISDEKAVAETYHNAKVYLQRYIDTHEENEELKKEMAFALNLLKEVNVTDGQSFNSPTSVRKKLRAQGDWNDDLNKAYERIASGNPNINDLRIIIQVAKPFNTAEVAKYSGSPTMQLRRRTIQAKNSEFLLLLADALSRASGKRSKMGAIQDFMEKTVQENEFGDERKGIDTVHFKSVGKVGVTGVVDMKAFDAEFDRMLEEGDGYDDPEHNGRFTHLKQYYLKQIKKSDTLEENDYNALLTEYLMMHVRRYNKEGKPTVQKKRDYRGEQRLCMPRTIDGIYTPPILKQEEILYNSEYVDAVPIESYIIQQEIPAHLLERAMLYGSQMRILGISDITPGTHFNVRRIDGQGEEYYRNLDDTTLVKEFKQLHAANITQAYRELMKEFGFDKLFDENWKLKKEFKDLSQDEKDEILINLEYLLQKELSKDMKYGLDIRRACTLVRNSDGHVVDFVVPLMDPVQSNRIQNLINSIIKKAINKQKIQGGSLVQVTAYDNDLHIRFQGKDGKELKTLSEFEKGWIDKHGTNRDDWEDAVAKEYTKYLELNQAGLAYFECYASVPDEKLEALITKKDGSLMSVKEVQKAMPKVWEAMSKMIGYRIPTEAKYSMIPLKIVGFLPKGSGQNIIMPKDITRLTGSDFDIDKLYIMMKDFLSRPSEAVFKYDADKDDTILDTILRIVTKARRPSEKEMDAFGKMCSNIIDIMDGVRTIRPLEGVTFSEFTEEEIDSFIEKVANPIINFVLEESYTEFSDLYHEIPEHAKSARDNRIIDLQWAVLTSEDTAVKMFSPQNFEDLKKTGRIIKIVKSRIVNPLTSKNWTWNELETLYLNTLEKKGVEEALEVLDNLLEEGRSYNITLPSSKIYFQRQNMQGRQLVGAAANNNVSHAFCSFQNIALDLSKKAASDEEGKAFTLLGQRIGYSGDKKHLTKVDPQRRFDGGLVSETLAKILAAVVDVASDPCTKDSNIDTFTVGVATTMARLGFNYDQIAMFLSQPVIVDLSDTYFSGKTDAYYTGEMAIRDVAEYQGYTLNTEAMRKAVQSASTLTEENLKKFVDAVEYRVEEDLPKGKNKAAYEFQGRVLQVFATLFEVSRKMQELTFCTKFNSVSNAAGPAISDTYEDMQKYDSFMTESDKDCFFIPEENETDAEGVPYTSAQEIINKDPILKAFFECTVDEKRGASPLFFRQFFPHYFEGFREVLEHFKTYYTRKNKISNKLYNQLIGDYMYFMLTHKNILQNENYDSGSVLPYDSITISEMVQNLPREYEKVLALKKSRTLSNEIIDNELGSNCIIWREADEFVKMDMLLFNNGQLGPEGRESIKDAWSDLVTMNDPGLSPSDNAFIRRFGVDLFFYNLMRSGFNFHPQTMMTLASVLVRYNALYSDQKDEKGHDTYVDYIAGLRALKKADEKMTKGHSAFITRFCQQFIRNHSNNTALVPTLGEENPLIHEDTEGDTLVISVPEKEKNKLSPVTLTDKNACKYISVIWKDPSTGNSERALYELDQDIIKDGEGNLRITYKEVTLLGLQNKFIEYNANSNLEKSAFEDLRGELDEEDGNDVISTDEEDDIFDQGNIQGIKDEIFEILQDILGENLDIKTKNQISNAIDVSAQAKKNNKLWQRINDLLTAKDNEDDSGMHEAAKEMNKIIAQMRACGLV